MNKKQLNKPLNKQQFRIMALRVAAVGMTAEKVKFYNSGKNNRKTH